MAELVHQTAYRIPHFQQVCRALNMYILTRVTTPGRGYCRQCYPITGDFTQVLASPNVDGEVDTATANMYNIQLNLVGILAPITLPTSPAASP